MRRFPHRIRIESYAETADGAGGSVRSWAAYTEEPARIERMQSIKFNLERVAAGGGASPILLHIHFRAHALTSAITKEMRAYDVDRGTRFAINAVQDLKGDGRTITITATEEAPS